MTMTDSRRRAGPGSLARRILQRLRARPDSEHEMRFNGTGFAIAILIYLLGRGAADPAAIIVLSAYMSLNVCVFAHILLHPGICRPRRIFSILNDFISLFWVMHLGDDATTILFPIYLWVILGNGFRFGIPFLALATAAGLTSFGALVTTTPFWRSEPALSAGLLGSMLLVALCAVPLIRRLLQAKQEAEAANRESQLLLASVRHDLLTPLTAILGTGSVLQDTKLDPAQREMTRRVVAAGERLMTLIDGIPNGSRLAGADAGRPQAPPGGQPQEGGDNGGHPPSRP
ncbi:histidine kinase dimerization/phospho-acceptor domain-containing protein [Inquilinus sp. NPDC058860]|uniref:histidine kinase dimerization/phospho-acceptor domain-containing protein n=1 Tax=Inquilinus sp. NPDC058860 TaxID=3346652 RepID=UPI0036744352